MDEKNSERVVALYEDGRSLANIAVWSVILQVKRLETSDTENSDFVQQPLADFHFLISALTRLRNAAELISKVAPLSSAIEKFDTALPDLKNIRNILEHIDDYRLGDGHNKNVKITDLQTYCFGETIEWLGYKLNLNDAKKSSEVLFESIKDNPPQAYIERTKEFVKQKN